MKKIVTTLFISTLIVILSVNIVYASKVSGNLNSNTSINNPSNNSGGSGSSGGSSTGGGGGSISNSNKPLNQNIVVPPAPQQPQSNTPETTPTPDNQGSNNIDSLVGSVQPDTDSGTSSPKDVFTTTNLANEQVDNSQTAAASDAFSWLSDISFLWILIALLVLLGLLLLYKYLKNNNEKNY